MFFEKISTLSNSFDVQLETDISVITLDDGINHTYCSEIKWDKNNYTPLGTAQLIMPYDKEIEKYWIKYSGPVIIHANLNSRPHSITQATMYNMPNTESLNIKNYQKNNKVEKKKNKKTNKIHLQNDYYNYSFIGKTTRFKQIGKTFVAYLEDLGWKFLQKVPKDFRDTYIAGQSLDDAFQAICEFMNIDFAYSIEDLSKYNFSADGYSIEKDRQIIENVPSLFKEWKIDKYEAEESFDESTGTAIDNNDFESQGLIDYLDKNQSNNQVNNQLNNQLNEEPNQQLSKIEKYQEEFDEKIKDLFIGNSLYDSNISDPILNYNSITITPKIATSQITNTNTPIQNQENNQEEVNQ